MTPKWDISTIFVAIPVRCFTWSAIFAFIDLQLTFRWRSQKEFEANQMHLIEVPDFCLHPRAALLSRTSPILLLPSLTQKDIHNVVISWKLRLYGSERRLLLPLQEIIRRKCQGILRKIYHPDGWEKTWGVFVPTIWNYIANAMIFFYCLGFCWIQPQPLSVAVDFFRL